MVFSESIGAIETGSDHDLMKQSYFGMWRADSVIGMFPWLVFLTESLPLLRLAIAALITSPSGGPSGFGWVFGVDLDTQRYRPSLAD